MSNLVHVLFLLSCSKLVRSQNLDFLGCWKDSDLKRALPSLEHKHHLLNGKYSKRSAAITKCAQVAADRGFTLFALQNGGQCFAGPKGEKRYQMYGPSNLCKDGKGGKWSSSVYSLRTSHSRSVHKPFDPSPWDAYCSRDLDIVILLDSSGTINKKNKERWKEMKKFVWKFMKGFDEHARFGVIRYGSDPDIAVDMLKAKSQEEITEVLKSLDMSGGKRTLNDALKRSWREQLKENNRTAADKVIIAMTTGDLPYGLYGSSQFLSDHNVRVIAIGIDKMVHYEFLQSIASYRGVNNIFSVNSEQLEEVAPFVYRDVCNTMPEYVSETTTTTTTTPTPPKVEQSAKNETSNAKVPRNSTANKVKSLGKLTNATSRNMTSQKNSTGAHRNDIPDSPDKPTEDAPFPSAVDETNASKKTILPSSGKDKTKGTVFEKKWRKKNVVTAVKKGSAKEEVATMVLVNPSPDLNLFITDKEVNEINNRRANTVDSTNGIKNESEQSEGNSTGLLDETNNDNNETLNLNPDITKDQNVFSDLKQSEEQEENQTVSKTSNEADKPTGSSKQSDVTNYTKDDTSGNQQDDVELSDQKKENETVLKTSNEKNENSHSSEQNDVISYTKGDNSDDSHIIDDKTVKNTVDEKLKAVNDSSDYDGNIKALESLYGASMEGLKQTKSTNKNEDSLESLNKPVVENLDAIQDFTAQHKALKALDSASHNKDVNASPKLVKNMSSSLNKLQDEQISSSKDGNLKKFASQEIQNLSENSNLENTEPLIETPINANAKTFDVARDSKGSDSNIAGPGVVSQTLELHQGNGKEHVGEHPSKHVDYKSLFSGKLSDKMKSHEIKSLEPMFSERGKIRPSKSQLSNGFTTKQNNVISNATSLLNSAGNELAEIYNKVHNTAKTNNAAIEATKAQILSKENKDVINRNDVNSFSKLPSSPNANEYTGPNVFEIDQVNHNNGNVNKTKSLYNTTSNDAGGDKSSSTQAMNDIYNALKIPSANNQPASSISSNNEQETISSTDAVKDIYAALNLPTQHTPEINAPLYHNLPTSSRISENNSNIVPAGNLFLPNQNSQIQQSYSPTTSQSEDRNAAIIPTQRQFLENTVSTIGPTQKQFLQSASISDFKVRANKLLEDTRNLLRNNLAIDAFQQSPKEMPKSDDVGTKMLMLPSKKHELLNDASSYNGFQSGFGAVEQVSKNSADLVNQEEVGAGTLVQNKNYHDVYGVNDDIQTRKALVERKEEIEKLLNILDKQDKERFSGQPGNTLSNRHRIEPTADLKEAQELKNVFNALTSRINYIQGNEEKRREQSNDVDRSVYVQNQPTVSYFSTPLTHGDVGDTQQPITGRIDLGGASIPFVSELSSNNFLGIAEPQRSISNMCQTKHSSKRFERADNFVNGMDCGSVDTSNNQNADSFSEVSSANVKTNTEKLNQKLLKFKPTIMSDVTITASSLTKGRKQTNNNVKVAAVSFNKPESDGKRVDSNKKAAYSNKGLPKHIENKNKNAKTSPENKVNESTRIKDGSGEEINKTSSKTNRLNKNNNKSTTIKNNDMKNNNKNDNENNNAENAKIFNNNSPNVDTGKKNEKKKVNEKVNETTKTNSSGTVNEKDDEVVTKKINEKVNEKTKGKSDENFKVNKKESEKKLNEKGIKETKTKDNGKVNEKFSEKEGGKVSEKTKLKSDENLNEKAIEKENKKGKLNEKVGKKMDATNNNKGNEKVNEKLTTKKNDKNDKTNSRNDTKVKEKVKENKNQKTEKSRKGFEKEEEKFNSKDVNGTTNKKGNDKTSTRNDRNESQKNNGIVKEKAKMKDLVNEEKKTSANNRDKNTDESKEKLNIKNSNKTEVNKDRFKASKGEEDKEGQRSKNAKTNQDKEKSELIQNKNDKKQDKDFQRKNKEKEEEQERNNKQKSNRLKTSAVTIEMGGSNPKNPINPKKIRQKMLLNDYTNHISDIIGNKNKLGITSEHNKVILNKISSLVDALEPENKKKDQTTSFNASNVPHINDLHQLPHTYFGSPNPNALFSVYPSPSRPLTTSKLTLPFANPSLYTTWQVGTPVINNYLQSQVTNRKNKALLKTAGPSIAAFEHDELVQPGNIVNMFMNDGKLSDHVLLNLNSIPNGLREPQLRLGNRDSRLSFDTTLKEQYKSHAQFAKMVQHPTNSTKVSWHEVQNTIPVHLKTEKYKHLNLNTLSRKSKPATLTKKKKNVFPSAVGITEQSHMKRIGNIKPLMNRPPRPLATPHHPKDFDGLFEHQRKGTVPRKQNKKNKQKSKTENAAKKSLALSNPLLWAKNQIRMNTEVAKPSNPKSGTWTDNDFSPKLGEPIAYTKNGTVFHSFPLQGGKREGKNKLASTLKKILSASTAAKTSKDQKNNSITKQNVKIQNERIKPNVINKPQLIKSFVTDKNNRYENLESRLRQIESEVFTTSDFTNTRQITEHIPGFTAVGDPAYFDKNNTNYVADSENDKSSAVKTHEDDEEEEDSVRKKNFLELMRQRGLRPKTEYDVYGPSYWNTQTTNLHRKPRPKYSNQMSNYGEFIANKKNAANTKHDQHAIPGVSSGSTAVKHLANELYRVRKLYNSRKQGAEEKMNLAKEKLRKENNQNKDGGKDVAAKKESITKDFDVLHLDEDKPESSWRQLLTGELDKDIVSEDESQLKDTLSTSNFVKQAEPAHRDHVLPTKTVKNSKFNQDQQQLFEEDFPKLFPINEFRLSDLPALPKGKSYDLSTPSLGTVLVKIRDQSKDELKQHRPTNLVQKKKPIPNVVHKPAPNQQEAHKQTVRQPVNQNQKVSPSKKSLTLSNNYFKVPITENNNFIESKRLPALVYYGSAVSRHRDTSGTPVIIESSDEIESSEEEAIREEAQNVLQSEKLASKNAAHDTAGFMKTSTHDNLEETLLKDGETKLHTRLLPTVKRRNGLFSNDSATIVEHKDSSDEENDAALINMVHSVVKESPEESRKFLKYREKDTPALTHKFTSQSDTEKYNGKSPNNDNELSALINKIHSLNNQINDAYNNSKTSLHGGLSPRKDKEDTVFGNTNGANTVGKHLEEFELGKEVLKHASDKNVQDKLAKIFESDSSESGTENTLIPDKDMMNINKNITVNHTVGISFTEANQSLSNSTNIRSDMLNTSANVVKSTNVTDNLTDSVAVYNNSTSSGGNGTITNVPKENNETQANNTSDSKAHFLQSRFENNTQLSNLSETKEQNKTSLNNEQHDMQQKDTKTNDTLSNKTEINIGINNTTIGDHESNNENRTLDGDDKTMSSLEYTLGCSKPLRILYAIDVSDGLGAGPVRQKRWNHLKRFIKDINDNVIQGVRHDFMVYNVEPRFIDHLETCDRDTEYFMTADDCLCSRRNGTTSLSGCSVHSPSGTENVEDWGIQGPRTGNALERARKYYFSEKLHNFKNVIFLISHKDSADSLEKPENNLKQDGISLVDIELGDRHDLKRKRDFIAHARITNTRRSDVEESSDNDEHKMKVSLKKLQTTLKNIVAKVCKANTDNESKKKSRIR